MSVVVALLSGEECMRLARRLGRAEFALRCAHPFLVLGESPEEEREFETRIIDVSAIARLRGSGSGPVEAAGGAAADGPAHVFPVEKSERNPYRDRISVGRAATCDLVLPSPHVSKLHAHLLRAQDGGWEVRDADSSNGTFLRGERLRPGERARLRAGDALRFAFLETFFLDAGLLHDWARER